MTQFSRWFEGMEWSVTNNKKHHNGALQQIESLQSRIIQLESHTHELTKSHRQLDLIVKSTGLGTWDWYVQTGQVEFNERWANIIGYTLDELSPVSIETWMKYAHPDDFEESNRLLQKVWAGNSDYYRFESRMKHKDGHWIWVYDTGQVIEWERKGVPKRMMGTHLDISEKKATIDELDLANRQLKELSYVDSLTKIPNKRAYDEEIKRELVATKRSKAPLSLLLIDLDNFKGYNDKHGHERGDDLLYRVAQLIQGELLRKTDFVARIGGDEFAVILPFTDLAGAHIKALKIQNAVDSEKDQGGFAKRKRDVSLSIGISSSEISLESLFENADTALYSAKKQGRNRIEVYASC